MSWPIDKFALAALGFGVAVPVLYYGAQLAAVPFFPEFSILTNSASDLGSDRSTRPWVLNTGAILTGISAVVAAFGFVSAIRRVGSAPILAWLVFAALVSCGAGCVNAGLFPLPDPRHNPGPLSVGMFLLPALLPLAVRKVQGAKGLKIYLVGNFVLFLALIPLLSGAVGVDTRGYGGLLQRIAALTVFAPIGVTAFALARRVRLHPPATPLTLGA